MNESEWCIFFNAKDAATRIIRYSGGKAGKKERKRGEGEKMSVSVSERARESVCARVNRIRMERPREAGH